MTKTFSYPEEPTDVAKVSDQYNTVWDYISANLWEANGDQVTWYTLLKYRGPLNVVEQKKLTVNLTQDEINALKAIVKSAYSKHSELFPNEYNRLVWALEKAE